METLRDADQPGGAHPARQDGRRRGRRAARLRGPAGAQGDAAALRRLVDEVAPQLYGPLVEAANRLGYTIYPVDVAQSDARAGLGARRPGRRTGGRVVVSAKMEAFREVVADTGSYYWLGFTPAWKADDHGHQVTVEPRRAGLAVRARERLLRPVEADGERDEGRERAALRRRAEQDRRLIVQLGEPKRAGHGKMEIPVTLGVPVESLALTPKGGGYVAETPLAMVAMDEKGGARTCRHRS